MRVAVLYLLFFLFALSFTHSQSIDGKLTFDHLSIQEGLSQATVLCSVQDHFGFMWLGTRDGLNRYDGYSFQIYRNKPDDDKSIAGNTIYEIDEDHEGNLWMITDKGVSLLIRDLSTFENYFPDEALSFYSLIIDDQDEIWLGSSSGLMTFDRDTKKIIKYRSGNLEVDDILKNPIYSFRSNPNTGEIWMGTSKGQLYVLNEAGNVRVVQPSIPIPSRIEDIAIDSLNNLWIGTYGEGVFHLNKEGRVLSEHSSDQSKNNLIDDHVRALELDQIGNLWIGTFDGLSILNINTHEITNINHREGDPSGLSHNSIRSITRDIKGSLWIGTYFGGVNIFDFDNQRFKHFYRLAGEPNSLSHNVIGAFSEDSNGNLIIGTERGGVNISSERNNYYQTFVHNENDPYSLGGNIIKSLHATEDAIWVGVFKGGLNKLYLHNGKVNRLQDKVKPKFTHLTSSIVNVITPDGTGNLWIGTDEGIYYFDTEKSKYRSFKGMEELNLLLKKKSVKGIILDKNQNIWIASRGVGLVFFDPSLGTVRQYSTYSVSGENLSLEEVNHVFEDGEGTFWISTHGGGVVNFHPESGRAKVFLTDDGLSNNTVFGIMRDKSDRLWAITLNGPAVYDYGTDTFKSYTYSSGFPIEEVNEGAFYTKHSGEFIIGGSNGYVEFDPDELVDNSFKPPLAITRLLISNQEVIPRDQHNILEKVISETKEITLNHYQSVLTFEFAALSYLRPENNRYAYMLVGFDEHWNDIGNKHSVTFTNLREGDYILNIRGSNNDGILSDEVSLAIAVLPPPWKTWWAYSIYAFLFVFLFLIIRYNSLKGLKLKHDLKLEQVEKEKWKEVHKLKLRYFTDVSHEFRTPLTLIISPLEEMLQSKKVDKWIKKRLKSMYYNSKRLLHLIDQILEIRELETGHAELKLAPVKIDAVLGSVVDSFKTLADKKKIQLIYDYPLLDKFYLIDVDKIEKILFNLLSNSFKFTPPGGNIEVYLSLVSSTEKDTFEFKVMDTGSGISQNQIEKVFDRFYKQNNDGSGAGIGLSLTKSLVELLEGEITVQSTPGEGTMFCIRIPFQRASESGDANGSNLFIKPLPLEYQHTLLPSHEDPSQKYDCKDSVLFVEDNIELRNYLVDHFKKKYKVFSAINGKEALEIASEKGASIIVSDIMMEVMDGITLCKYLKSDERVAHIPIILLTAKSSYVDRLEGLEIGADDYLSKPFIMKELEARIENILSNRKRLYKRYKSNYYLPNTEEITFNTHDEKLMNRILEVMEENLSESNLTVEFLAAEVALSRVQLFRKLKGITGLSPTEFIKDFRMKRAVHLFSTKEVKVAEVAYEVGFQDVKYFSKCFKKTYGISPGKFGQPMEELQI